MGNGFVPPLRFGFFVVPPPPLLSGQGPSHLFSPRCKNPSLNTCGTSASRAWMLGGSAYLATLDAPRPAMWTESGKGLQRGSGARTRDLQDRVLEGDVKRDAEITDSESFIPETTQGLGGVHQQKNVVNNDGGKGELQALS
ncbi:hypothetical protein Salat_1715600 [Sesamum alatum]|uniref:Uncharacterized protein n=1 Tax=Sesamum alatum TaxID=300844 RepID=A0AAE1Y8B8_9LAMI|nr:hypothetical protein Salat_1715600 [Sesamum alatum]